MKKKSGFRKTPQKRRQEPKVPPEWLYLSPEPVTLRRIYEIFEKDMLWKAELWEAAEVLEITIPDAGSLDMERMDMELWDEAGKEYLEAQKIRTVFAVTIRPESYEEARAVMEKIMEHAGGYFCGDTEDFQPMVR